MYMYGLTRAKVNFVCVTWSVTLWSYSGVYIHNNLILETGFCEMGFCETGFCENLGMGHVLGHNYKHAA